MRMTGIAQRQTRIRARRQLFDLGAKRAQGIHIGHYWFVSPRKTSGNTAADASGRCALFDREQTIGGSRLCAIRIDKRFPHIRVQNLGKTCQRREPRVGLAKFNGAHCRLCRTSLKRESGLRNVLLRPIDARATTTGTRKVHGALMRTQSAYEHPRRSRDEIAFDHSRRGPGSSQWC